MAGSGDSCGIADSSIVSFNSSLSADENRISLGGSGDITPSSSSSDSKVELSPSSSPNKKSSSSPLPTKSSSSEFPKASRISDSCNKTRFDCARKGGAKGPLPWAADFRWQRNGREELAAAIGKYALFLSSILISSSGTVEKELAILLS
ncbi:unnamed protein product [Parnassius mnemosyne]|uniref:Uncharacterized protein n=1 Tax=Parnassius mnemosyne TaxID=213953 RepID=A0AAV1LGT3_9NEOP